MDLKDKIAARRRELAVEAQRAEQARRRELDAQRKVEAEERAVESVERAAEQRALSDAAMDRWSGADIGVLVLLCIFVLIGLLLRVWPGLIMLAVLWMYVRSRMDKYKKQIRAESSGQTLLKMP